MLDRKVHYEMAAIRGIFFFVHGLNIVQLNKMI